MQKKIFSRIFNVLINESKKLLNCKNLFDDKNKILSKKIFVLKFYFATIILFQSAQHFYEKREGSGSASVLVTDPRGPKTYGS